MVKSSCLKMMACGGGDTAAADDDVVVDHHTLASAASQTKASGDKRGWSFRKKAGRHRVLGNNIPSQATTVADKDFPQVVSTDFQPPVKATRADEKPQLPEPVDKVGDASALAYDGESKTSVGLIASANDCSVACEKPKVSQVLVDSDNDSNLSEADDTVVILEHGDFEPSADSGILAELVVSKAESDQTMKPETLNSTIALEDGNDALALVDEHVAIIAQASIRAFLAQQRFLQLKNVVMLQSVIRGHLVRRNAVETFHCIRGIAKVQALVRAQSSKTLDRDDKKCEGQFSTAKLLKNSFARQLLESTPKPKSVNARCDPLSPNSAWGWLERWMSAASEVGQKTEPIEELKSGSQAEAHDSHADVELSSTSLSGSSVSGVIVDEMAKPSENEGNPDEDFVDSQSSFPIFVEKQESDQQMTVEVNEDVNSIKMAAIESVISVSQVDPVSLVDEDAADIQQPKLSSKRSASEELNGEVKKLSCGSRNVTDSAIIVAQTNVEGPTSFANPISSPHQVGAENPSDTSSYLEETNSKISEPSVVGVNQQNVVAGSECGTELSVTSTLDSPDRCEIEDAQPVPEVKILETSIDDIDENKEGQVCKPHISDLPSEVTSVTPDTGGEQKAESEMKASDELQGIDAGVMETKEEDTCLEHVTGLQAEKSPPRSHTSMPESQGTPSSQVPESQGTPSSQVSVKDKRNRIGKSGSEKKQRTSLSVGKRSPSNPNLDSGARTSVEHLPKDHKNGKRNSFGSTRSDIDQEPRDSNSNSHSSSVPSYMQATKSAKAKAHSPRSSPDLNDKKRQSLPGAGAAAAAVAGRQGSPRVQRSASEAAAPSPKPNASRPPNERKWQR
ncbi:hypothetical protein RND81_02G068900 [Saponaria officinalis]|uniref:DUF4005 domain-containing protein n=1 Tax=Saponaria officinalis TaxID=3572 RepID=A0AAW1MQL5_SAPOF